MKIQKCKKCKAPCQTPRHLYCFECSWKREAQNKQRTDLKLSEEIPEYDCPIRLDKLVSIAINEAC